ncbi:MAG: TIM barrel protein [Caldilineaceae bacterium]
MSTQADQSRFAVSTWSLHRTLGRPPISGPDTIGGGNQLPPTNGALPLLELPAKVSAFGIHKLEICHFHLPTRDADYLAQLRAALEAADVTLWQFLIDGGDITHPQHAARDIAWIESWIDTAATLGATRARVSGGKSQPSADAFAQSNAALARLADYAAARNVRLMTENWQTLLANPEAVFAVLNGLDHVGLLADLGNWGGPTKYADLAQILPRAESCHAKAYFSAPADANAPIATGMDRADYERCLELCRAADFSGPYSLIYDGPDANEWAGLQAEMAVVAAYL